MHGIKVPVLPVKNAINVWIQPLYVNVKVISIVKVSLINLFFPLY